MSDARVKKLARKAERVARREIRTMPAAVPVTTWGRIQRWRCARRCGEGKWERESEIPKLCPSCNATIDIER